MDKPKIVLFNIYKEFFHSEDPRLLCTLDNCISINNLHIFKTGNDGLVLNETIFYVYKNELEIIALISSSYEFTVLSSAKRNFNIMSLLN